MANRLIGNVLIIDSAAGNRFVLDDVVGGNQIRKFYVNAIAIYQVNTTGSVTLTGVNTATDLIFKSDWLALTADSMGKVFVNNPSWYSFGQLQRMEDIKSPTITAGTAFLYLA